jgi:hypothetical protein
VSIVLLPEERVLWTGSPARYPLFDRSDLLLIPISLVVSAMALTLLLRAPAEIRPFIIALLVLELGAAVARLAWRQVTLRTTECAVTQLMQAQRWQIRRQHVELREVPHARVVFDTVSRAREARLTGGQS